MAMVIDEDMLDTTSWEAHTRDVREWLDSMNPFKWTNPFTSENQHYLNLMNLTRSRMPPHGSLVCFVQAWSNRHYDPTIGTHVSEGRHRRLTCHGEHCNGARNSDSCYVHTHDNFNLDSLFVVEHVNTDHHDPDLFGWDCTIRLR